MSIMGRIFGSTPQPGEQQQSQQQQVAPITPGGTGVAKADGSVPAFPKVGEGEASPLAEYEKLWEKPADGKPVGIPSAVPSFTLDPATLEKTANGLDFTGGMTDEDMKAIFGPEANVAGIRGFINKTNRMTWQNAYAASAKTMESALGLQEKSLIDKVLPEINRRQDISRGLAQDNSALWTDPATKPMMEMLQERFASAYPKASAEEVKTHVEKYMIQTAGMIAGTQGKVIADAPKAQRGEMDWESWANS